MGDYYLTELETLKSILITIPASAISGLSSLHGEDGNHKNLNSTRHFTNFSDGKIDWQRSGAPAHVQPLPPHDTDTDLVSKSSSLNMMDKPPEFKSKYSNKASCTVLYIYLNHLVINKYNLVVTREKHLVYDERSNGSNTGQGIQNDHYISYPPVEIASSAAAVNNESQELLKQNSVSLMDQDIPNAAMVVNPPNSIGLYPQEIEVI